MSGPDLDTQVEEVVIASRFRGPPRSGNGGYTCGVLARHLPGDVCVRLAAPPPLNVALRLEFTTDETRLLDGESLIGTARRAHLDLVPPPAPSLAEADEASHGYLGFVRHDFPECFVCGPARAHADGLRIFAGALDDGGMVAAPWIPDRSLVADGGMVGRVFVWSALDCPGAFAALPLPEGKTIVLGELCASIRGDVRPGERYIAAGWPLGRDGRKRIVGTAIYTERGTVVALARATWIEVPALDFVL